LRWRSRIKFQNLPWVRQRVPDFFCQIRFAVLAHRNVIDIGDFGADRIQARLDREGRKPGIVLYPVQAFFAMAKTTSPSRMMAGGGVSVKHVEAEDQRCG